MVAQDGFTPLHAALVSDHVAAALALIAAGADVSLRCGGNYGELREVSRAHGRCTRRGGRLRVEIEHGEDVND